MLIIPAIDLSEGRCVRLIQGKANSETVYSKNPTAMAMKFEQAGAKRIHLVDLDGAFKGKSVNKDCIRAIVKNVSVPVQVGGGIRKEEDIERMFDLGVKSVIVGTLAVKKPKILENSIKRYPGEKIILGIDMLKRKIAIQGWQKETSIDDVEFAKRWRETGIQRVVFTDISRDGMLKGTNILALKDFANRSKLKVVASGGISSIADLNQINHLKDYGVDQVIIGKAIYEGKIHLEDIFEC